MLGIYLGLDLGIIEGEFDLREEVTNIALFSSFNHVELTAPSHGIFLSGGGLLNFLHLVVLICTSNLGCSFILLTSHVSQYPYFCSMSQKSHNLGIIRNDVPN